MADIAPEAPDKVETIKLSSITTDPSEFEDWLLFVRGSVTRKQFFLLTEELIRYNLVP